MKIISIFVYSNFKHCRIFCSHDTNMNENIIYEFLPQTDHRKSILWSEKYNHDYDSILSLNYHEPETIEKNITNFQFDDYILTKNMSQTQNNENFYIKTEINNESQHCENKVEKILEYKYETNIDNKCENLIPYEPISASNLFKKRSKRKSEESYYDQEKWDVSKIAKVIPKENDTENNYKNEIENYKQYNIDITCRKFIFDVNTENIRQNEQKFCFSIVDDLSLYKATIDIAIYAKFYKKRKGNIHENKIDYFKGLKEEQIINEIRTYVNHLEKQFEKNKNTRRESSFIINQYKKNSKNSVIKKDISVNVKKVTLYIEILISLYIIYETQKYIKVRIQSICDVSIVFKFFYNPLKNILNIFFIKNEADQLIKPIEEKIFAAYIAKEIFDSYRLDKNRDFDGFIRLISNEKIISYYNNVKKHDDIDLRMFFESCREQKKIKSLIHAKFDILFAPIKSEIQRKHAIYECIYRKIVNNYTSKLTKFRIISVYLLTGLFSEINESKNINNKLIQECQYSVRLLAYNYDEFLSICFFRFFWFNYIIKMLKSFDKSRDYFERHIIMLFISGKVDLCVDLTRRCGELLSTFSYVLDLLYTVQYNYIKQKKYFTACRYEFELTKK